MGSKSWIAWDERSSRRVLVALVTDEEAERLSAARTCEHAHLARLLDVQAVVPPAELPAGCEANLAAAVAELAQGRSLATRVQTEGPLGAPRAVAWTLRVARALGELHRSGSSHQALSPAAIVDRAAGRPVAPVLTWLRALPYGPALSPEVLAGQEPGPADDVWSLGVTLYFALTGVYPFAGENSEALLKSLQRPAAPLSEHGVDDPLLQKVLDLVLDRDAQRRLRSAPDLIALLEGYEVGDPQAARPLVARPPRLGGGRNLTAGLTKPGPLHKSLAGVVFDIAAAENPEFAELGPEPNFNSRTSAEPPQPVPAVAVERVSAPHPQRRVPSLPPINPFQKKTRWPALLLLTASAGAAAAVLVLRTTAPNPTPVAPVTTVAPTTKPATVPSAPKLTKAERLRACTASYFEEGTFQEEASFDFVCQEGPLHVAARQLYELSEAKTDARLAQQAAQAVAAEQPPVDVVRGDLRAARVRRPLGWYELLSTAIVRRSCCSPPPPVELPKTPGWCAQLGDVVEDLAEDSARSADLAPRVKRFDRAIDCLYANRTAIPYQDYAERPLDEVQRAALQNFLSLAAMSEAKRRKLE
jgi:serine/threonine protein kinase